MEAKKYQDLWLKYDALQNTFRQLVDDSASEKSRSVDDGPRRRRKRIATMLPVLWRK